MRAIKYYALELDGYEPFVPLCRKILDLLKIQDRWFAFSDDCRPLTLLSRQHHRSRYC